MQLLITKDVNINVCPLPGDLSDITNATLGDLHGNALKLLFFLTYLGIFQINEEIYKRLVHIYHTPTAALTQELLDEFDFIVGDIPILNRTLLVRLIGDELADRGSNDYFTLRILEKLYLEEIPIEILLSNHGIGFIEAYEDKPTFLYDNLGSDYATSLYNLQTMIDMK